MLSTVDLPGSITNWFSSHFPICADCTSRNQSIRQRACLAHTGSFWQHQVALKGLQGTKRSKFEKGMFCSIVYRCNIAVTIHNQEYGYLVRTLNAYQNVYFLKFKFGLFVLDSFLLLNSLEVAAE